MTRLNQLDLHANSIATFPFTITDTFKTLASLSLAKNGLRDLGAATGTFSTKPTRLQTLDLSFNQLQYSDIDSSWLKQASNLNQLILARNSLSLIPDTIKSLSNLVYLDLSVNADIQIVKRGDIISKSLQYLYLQQCGISSIDYEGFVGLFNLLELNVEQNYLTTPRAIWFQDLLNIQLVQWDKNPWTCDCHSIGFREFLSVGKLRTRAILGDTVQCYTPSNYTGIFIDEIPIHDLAQFGTCDWTAPTAIPTRPPNGLCPKSCSCSNDNTVVDCSRQGLTEVPFPMPLNAEQIIMSRNQISTFDTTVFNALPYLQTLYIDNNLFTSIPKNALPSTVTFLDAHNNMINQSDFTSSFPQYLEKLDLSYNAMSSAVTLPNLARIVNLNMNYNYIPLILVSGLPSGATLGVLRTVSLKSNLLTEIPTWFSPTREIFQRSTSLDISFNNIVQLSGTPTLGIGSIDLSSNKIISITPGYFDKYITALSLNYNKLQTLQQGQFGKATKLATLYLSGNGLKALPDISSTPVSTIDLSKNAFSSVPMDQLYQYLFNLDISSNALTTLSTSSSSNTTSLILLNLSNNPLKTLDNNWVASCTSLAVLQCQNCSLTAYPDDVKSILGLGYLDLSYNSIVAIDTIGELGALGSLILNNNNLDSYQVSKTAFDSLTILTTLALDNNKLTTPYARWFKSLKKLQQFSWNNNPWNCDCEAVPFAQLLESELVNYRFKIIISQTVMCTTPADFANEYIDDVGVYRINDELSCVFTTPAGFTTPTPEKCPLPCGCYKNPATGFFVVDCANLGLDFVPELPKQTNVLLFQNNNLTILPTWNDVRNGNLNQVNFQNNRIRSVPAKTFNLPHLVSVNLSQNKIRSFSFAAWSPSLQTLDLSSNDIRRLGDGQGFNGLYSLTVLRLGYNKLSAFGNAGTRGIYALKTLDLSWNRFTEFPALSKYLTGLQSIYLDGNEIPRLAFSSTIVLPQLTYLSCQQCVVLEMTTFFLEAFPGLQTFILAQNQLKTLAAFPVMTNLTTFNVNFNNLVNITDNAFQNTTLTNFYATNNQLSTWPNALSQIFGQLVNVDLSFNELTSLGSGVTVIGQNFRELTLKENKLTTTDFTDSWLTGYYLPRLTNLDVSSNSLNAIPGDFNGLKYLTELQMNRNDGIQVINKGDISGLSQLRSLSLQGCSVTKMDPMAFNSMYELAAINLENNFLTTPDPRWFRSLSNLNSLQWEKNPWDCDCHAIPFKEVLLTPGSPIPQSLRTAVSDTIVCQSPQAYLGGFLDDVPLYYLTEYGNCTTPTAIPTRAPAPANDCPLECQCEAKNRYVDCSARKLTSVPKMPKEAVYIYLNDNQITSFEASDFSSLVNLTQVFFYDNFLSAIPDGAFGSKVILLDFHNNKIATNDLTNVLPAYVQNVDISNNAIVGSVTLPNIGRLTELYLSSNSITSLSVNGATNIQDLTVLDLSYNQLTSVPTVMNPPACKQASNLNLAGNQITNAKLTTINAKIRVINLASNALTSVIANTFNSSCLVDLNLNSNQISNINNNAFQNAGRLSILSLNTNKLAILGAIAYGAIEDLDISNNAFVTPPVNSLPSSIIALNMAGNQLTSLGGNPVGLNVSRLLTVDFSSNPSLKSLDNAWLPLAINLKKLFCVNCGLTSYGEDVQTLRTLQEINLNRNAIQSIDTFGYLPSLQVVYLQYNQIKSIQKSAFDDNFSLKTLALDNNNLTTPYARWFKTPRSISSLSWNNNPWVCDCNAWEFAQLEEAEFVNPLFQRTLQNTVLCTAPQQFAGAYLCEVGVHQIFDTLNCVVPTAPSGVTTRAPSTCPGSCTKRFRNSGIIKI